MRKNIGQCRELFPIFEQLRQVVSDRLGRLLLDMMVLRLTCHHHHFEYFSVFTLRLYTLDLLLARTERDFLKALSHTIRSEKNYLNLFFESHERDSLLQILIFVLSALN